MFRRTRQLQEEAGVPYWQPSTISPQQSPEDKQPAGSSGYSSAETSFVSEAASSSARRARAGTLPSSFGGSPQNVGVIGSPYRSSAGTPSRQIDNPLGGSGGGSGGGGMGGGGATVLSRLRSSTLSHPAQDSLSNAFGPSIFASSWNASRQVLSPTQSQYSRNEEEQTPVRTLDYLGLAETPTPSKVREQREAFGQDEGTTRALWIGNIPPNTPSAALIAMFGSFGSIESARVLTHKSCAFVNFDQLESAVLARSAFLGKELFPGAGPARIGFAKVPPQELPLPALPAGAPLENGELIELCRVYGLDEAERRAIDTIVSAEIEYEQITHMPELQQRMYDAPRLRDIRKKIDNAAYTPKELEAIAIDMLPEIAELASDYLGNTVVQKLFEGCEEDVKVAMLERVAPHLPEIGIHKNGTWAAQKIIDVVSSTREVELITSSLRRCAPALFLDQFGNYVLQCCLKFGSSMDDFLFEAMVSRTWEIAQGRYGARAMRACLESHHTTSAQKKLMAAVITVHAVQLATNVNGALLLTWLLDTCTLAGRHAALAPRLAAQIVHLCTHKLASLTVLKVINQRQEDDAREVLLDALFRNDDAENTVRGILDEPMHGPTVLFKILTTPYLDADTRTLATNVIRTVIQRQRYHPASGYKRLMDEVGLPTRGAGLSERRRYNATPDTALQALENLNLNTELTPMQIQQLQYQAMLQQNLRAASPSLGFGNFGQSGLYDAGYAEYYYQQQQHPHHAQQHPQHAHLNHHASSRSHTPEAYLYNGNFQAQQRRRF